MEILLKIPPHRIEEPKTGLRIQVSRVYAQAYIKEELWNFYYITYASFFLFGMHWPRISFCVFSPYINFTCPQKKKKKNQIEVYMISQNIISQIQSILPPMERWNQIHLPFWFAEFFSSERWRNKCIASFYETKSYYRLVTTSNQLIKTTTTLKKLKPCELFNHKVPIEFRT